MSDHIVRAVSADGYFKATAISGRDLVERARNIHTLLPVATAALGRTLMAASMMGDALKEENGSVTLQIKGGGPLGTVLAVSDCTGNVRGYVQNPHVDLMEKHPGKLDIGRGRGDRRHFDGHQRHRSERALCGFNRPVLRRNRR